MSTVDTGMLERFKARMAGVVAPSPPTVDPGMLQRFKSFSGDVPNVPSGTAGQVQMVGSPEISGHPSADPDGDVRRQIAARDAQAARDRELPYAARMAARGLSSLGGAADRVQDEWARVGDIARGDVSIIGGLTDTMPHTDPVLAPAIGRAIMGPIGGVIMDNKSIRERAGEVGSALDPLSGMIADTPSMAVDMAAPSSLAALVLGGEVLAPKILGSRAVQVPMRAMQRAVPKVARVAEKAATGGVHGGVFMGTQTGLRGGDVGDVAEATAIGTGLGVGFGLAGMSLPALRDRAKALGVLKGPKSRPAIESRVVEAESKVESQAAPETAQKGPNDVLEHQASEGGGSVQGQAVNEARQGAAVEARPLEADGQAIPRVEQRPVEQVAGPEQLAPEAQRRPQQDGADAGVVPARGVRQGGEPEVAPTDRRHDANATPTEPTDFASRRQIDELSPGEKPGRVTSARNEMNAKQRERMGMNTLDGPERRAFQSSLDMAVDRGIPERAMEISDEVLKKPRQLDDVETAGLVHHANTLLDKHDAVMEKLKAAKNDTEKVFAAAEANHIENQFDLLTTALKRAGTEQGRSLASRKLTINEDYRIVAVKSRARAVKGSSLTAKESARFDQLTKDLAESRQKLSEAHRQIAERDAEVTLKRHAGRRRLTPIEREAEFSQLLGRAKELLAKGCD